VRVLVVEDDVALATAIVRALRTVQVAAVVTGSAVEADRRLADASIDVVVLDIGLPDGDGFELCRRWRSQGIWTPVVMLTARADVDDRIRGLDAGADDYLTKPFALGELLARLRAVSRRETGARPVVLSAGDLRLDPATARAWRGEVEISLSAREFALLEAFLRNPGLVLTHAQLLDAAWDLGYEHRSNVVEVYVRYLREKVDRPFGVTSLETVRGLGYRLREDGGTAAADGSPPC
jgi:two-component system OmpR family response regulator